MLVSLRRLLIFGCMVMALVACSGNSEETAETTTTTSTTAAPTTSTAAPTTSPTTSSTTTTTIDPGPFYPLTGEKIIDDELPDHPAVVVKISNNDATARQVLRGIDQADIVFEERIEQSATRFASVFHSVLPEEVGSVRSARTSDIDIVANLNNPVFAFSGANTGVRSQVRQADANNVLSQACEDCGNPQFSLLSSYRRPNATVVNVVALLDTASDDAEPPPAIYDYSDNVADLGEPSPGVRILARVPANFVWSPTDAVYLRYQGSEPHMTRDDEQIAPQNVIVMTTEYRPSQIDRSSVDAVSIGTGDVIVYSNGHRVEGTWTRETAKDGYTLTTADGDPIGLTPGQTWVSMTPTGTSTELTESEAAAFG